jgi:hypothetical protein
MQIDVGDRIAERPNVQRQHQSGIASELDSALFDDLQAQQLHGDFTLGWVQYYKHRAQRVNGRNSDASVWEPGTMSSRTLEPVVAEIERCQVLEAAKSRGNHACGGVTRSEVP